MGTAYASINCNVAGIQASASASATAEGGMIQEPNAPMGYAGPISTDTDRVVTTTEVDPLIEALDAVVIFWATGIARDTVQSVTGADGQVIKLSSGGADHEGDTLPTDATAVIIAKEVVVDLSIPSGTMLAMAVNSDERAALSFRETADALISSVEHTVTSPYYYMDGMDVADPVGANDCVAIRVATASITSDKVVQMGILYNSVV